MKKIGALYYVSKDMLTQQDRETLCHDLSIDSKENRLYFAESKNIVLLYDKGDSIAVPRAYGLRYFGAPLQSELAYGDAISIEFTGTLRDDQPRIIQEVTKSQYPNGLISMPCGSGKTVLGIKLICVLKVRALVLVHKEFLLDQWRDRLLEFTNLSADDIGVIQGNKCEHDKPVCIGMVQSISKREYPAEMYNAFGFVITDEAHRVAAERWHLCLDKFPAASRIGLSATLNRSDGLENVFKYHLGEVIASSFGQKLTPEVFVFKFKAVLPRKYYFGDKVNIPGAISDLCEIAERNILITKILKQAVDKGRKVLVLSDRLKHLEMLRSMLSKERPNITSGKYVGGMTSEERRNSSQCQVIFGSFGISKEGLDIPDLDVLLLASPRGGLKQSIGRILREFPCKKKPVVVDVADESDSLKELAMLSNGRRAFYEKNGYEIKDFA